MKRLVLVQTTIGDYRQAVLDILVSRFGPRFLAYAGDRYFEPSLRTRVELGANLRLLTNRYLLGRRLLWQGGAISAAAHADVAILEFNPRILTVWVLLVIRRLLRRRTLVWGHAWSRSGRNSRTEPFRRLMRRLADGVIVYTSEQAEELGEVMPAKRVFVAPNAVYRASEMVPPVPAGPRDSFAFVGRLAPSKKPQDLVEAFIQARGRLPQEARLVIVGDGELIAPLRAQAKDVGDAIQFTGHVSDPQTLASLYSRCIAAVSPGPAGLSITQSLGFGVPILVARGERHGPEISAVEDGFNGRFYSPSTVSALGDALVSMAAEAAVWANRSGEIAAHCRAEYSAEAMADGLIRAAGLD